MSYVCDPTNIETETKRETDFKRSVQGLRHAKMSINIIKEVKATHLYEKSISQSTDMTETSYMQRPMNMTPPTLKLKQRNKCHFKLSIQGLKTC